MAKFKTWSYENGLILVMSLVNGVVALDRLLVSYLSNDIVGEFHLNNTQLGMLASSLSVAIAGSGFLLASLADATRKRKEILLVMLVLFSVGSAVSGLATGFLFLIVARFALGLAEGPLVPIAQSIVSLESSPHRRGLNMGVVLNLGAALIGLTAGPIVATQIAAAAGWRTAFFLSCTPGLALALGIAFLIRRPAEAARPAAAGEAGHVSLAAGLLGVLKTRNVILCILISGLYSTWLIVQSVFLPLYLVRMDGMKPTEMGWVVAATGLSTAIAGMAIPALSDRIGRRPAMALVTLLGVLAPLAALFVHGSSPLIAFALFVGFLGGGAGPLYVSIVPSESVQARYVATAMAISLAAGEILGGVLAPTLAGRAADIFGLGAPFWISAACAGACAILSLFLVETAPRRLRLAAA